MSSIEQHFQWPAVQQIHKKLTQSGYRSLIAGGAVRDLLLGRTPNDLDIATNATPEQVEALFEKTVMVGRQFGVSRVIVEGQDIEVATFRKDGEYKDGRKPETVVYSSEEEDAQRRDFTINAMFYDPDKKEVIDYVGGQKDIMKKTLQTVGTASLRFEEDKLRILRALRFLGQLDFHIEPLTQKAIIKYSDCLHQVSMERIRDEWGKLIVGDFAVKAISKSHDLNIWGHLFPHWNYEPQVYNFIWSQGIEDRDEAWILWFLLHNYESKERLAELGMRWKFSKDFIRKMVFIDQSLPLLKRLKEIEAVDVAIFLNQNHGRSALKVYQKIHKGKIKQDWVGRLRDAESFFKGKDHLPAPLVSGDDLISFGMSPGPEIAKNLKDLYRNQLKFKVVNKEELLKKLIK